MKRYRALALFFEKDGRIDKNLESLTNKEYTKFYEHMKSHMRNKLEEINKEKAGKQ